jgi:RNA polymerase sigma factor (sigma-70 family)
MMKKEIWFSSEKERSDHVPKKYSVRMTFEEVREQFTPMISGIINHTNNKFLFNKVEEADFRQELEIELWRAYEAYDPSSGYCFSTYLYPKLMKGVRNVTYSRYSQKNKSIGAVLSIQAPINDSKLKIEDMLFTDDTSFDNIAYQELMSIILSNVTENEKDLLKIILDSREYSVADYAEKYDITRQAANQRKNKLKKKLQNVVAKEYLEII